MADYRISMAVSPDVSAYRVEKLRSHATLTLSSGESVEGCFFLSQASAHLTGPERVGELLNSETGFFPFELHGSGAPRTVLLNRSQVLTVALAENEARSVPGYDVATRYLVSVGMTRGPRVMGEVCVYGRDGHARLSDWTREPDAFRYVECEGTTLLVNIRHVIDVSEAPHS